MRTNCGSGNGSAAKGRIETRALSIESHDDIGYPATRRVSNETNAASLAFQIMEGASVNFTGIALRDLGLSESDWNEVKKGIGEDLAPLFGATESSLKRDPTIPSTAGAKVVARLATMPQLSDSSIFANARQLAAFSLTTYEEKL